MSNLRTAAITWGVPTDLEGPELKVGDRAPAAFTLVGNDMKPVTGADLAGKKRIVCTSPSLDTPVCDTEMRRFNVEAERLGDVTVFFASMDLPFAQKRWCAATESGRIVALSDYKFRDFGTAYGVFAPSKGLLARAVFVIGADDVIRHVEYVPVVGTEPNYDAAIAAARAL